ncbi:helix-turn-helix domain-containing protein [Nocardia barduliensis]|uniref:helix-turn-helix domain-containing protein n=1 Tax=Nocardia barduliensis TaxID=2736643 RepID=UPI001571CA16|nr:helix-turn-helix domain-containing protein [Nocardia barduliensis]
MRTDRGAGALPSDLITLRDAAALAGGVHPKTIRRWISLDLLSGYRRGPRLLYVSRRELLELAQPLNAGGLA